MIVAVPQYPGAGRKQHYVNLLAGAIQRAGHAIREHDYAAPQPNGCDFAICWDFKHTPRLRAREARLPALVLEMPFYGSRATTVSLSWNEFGRASVRPPPGAAQRPQLRLHPWMESDAGTVVVFGQLPRDYATRDVNIDKWVLDSYYEARRIWQRKTLIRPHPHTLQSMGVANPWDTESYLEAARAWLTISYSSTAAVKSVFRGIPAVTIHPESMAWDVTGHSMDTRIKPDREAWAHWISYCQWSEDEIADGTALNHMLTAFDEARENARG